MTAQDFAALWNASATLDEAAERLGFSKNYASDIATIFRLHEMELQDFRGIRAPAKPPQSLAQRFYAAKEGR